MITDTEQRIKEIDKQVLTLSIIDAPAYIAVGLGLYAKFGTDGDAFLSILNNSLLVNIMLAIGTTVLVVCGYKVYVLLREKARLQSES